MSMITGPKLDAMRDELVSWIITTRDRLVEALEEGYPYRSVQLTPNEQIQEFVNMQPKDWLALTDRLRERHRGKTNQQELVQAELRKYQERMYTLMRRR